MDEHDYLSLDSHTAEALTAQLLAASAAVDVGHGEDDRLVGLDAEQQRQLVQLAQEHHRHQLEDARQAQQQLQHGRLHKQHQQHHLQEQQHHQQASSDGYVNVIASTSQLPPLAFEPSLDETPPTIVASPLSSAKAASLPFPSFHDEPHYLHFNSVEAAEAWLETQRVYARWGLKYFHRANNTRTQNAYKAEQAEAGGEAGSAGASNSPDSPGDLDVGGMLSTSGSMLDGTLSTEASSSADLARANSKKRGRGSGGSTTPAGGKRGPKVKWEWTKIYICNHAGKWTGSKAKDGKGKLEQSIKMGCAAKVYMRRRKESAEVEVEYRWRHNHNPAAVTAAATAAAKAVAPAKPKTKPKTKKLSQHQRVSRRQERERVAREQDDLQRQADALLPPVAVGVGDGGGGSLSSDMLSALGVHLNGHENGGNGGEAADEMDLSGYVQQQELGDDDDENDEGQLDPTLVHLTAFDDPRHHIDPLSHRPTDGDPSSGDGGPYDSAMPPTGHASGDHRHTQSDAYSMPSEADPSAAFQVLPTLDEHDQSQHHHHLDGGDGTDDVLLHGTASTASAEAFYASLGAPVMASVLVSTIQDALALADRCKDEAERNPQLWDPLKLQAVSERFRAARDELERLSTNGGQ